MQTVPFRLNPGDAQRYAHLRLRMLEEAPWAFALSPEEDDALTSPRFAETLAREQSAIVAVAAAEGTHPLIASAGIMRVTLRKSAHRAKLWGVFVEPDHRGGGLGRSVVAAAIDIARAWHGVDHVDLGVSENSPEAQRLYESLGFRTWGREPESIEWGGRRYDEIFMSLRL